MFGRLFVALLLVALMTGTAEARRVALLVGQDAYPGGSSATSASISASTMRGLTGSAPGEQS